MKIFVEQTNIKTYSKVFYSVGENSIDLCKIMEKNNEKILIFIFADMNDIKQFHIFLEFLLLFFIQGKQNTLIILILNCHFRSTHIFSTYLKISLKDFVLILY